MEALQPVVDKYSSRGLSRSDIWTLSAFVAVEMSMPSHDRIRFPYQYYGRKDCQYSMVGGPDNEMCHPDSSTGEVLRFFEREFGYSPGKYSIKSLKNIKDRKRGEGSTLCLILCLIHLLSSSLGFFFCFVFLQRRLLPLWVDIQ